MSGPALADGCPGVEGIHTLTPPSPFSTFALNDWMDPATGRTRQWTEQAWHTRLTGVEGIHDAPDLDDPRVKLVYQSGELPLPRFGRGRTITYSGILAAQTMSEMRNKVAALRAACLSGLVDPTAWLLNVAYDPTYDTSGLVFSAYGVPVGFTCPDTQVSGNSLPSPYQRAFQLSFRQSDGRWWCTPAGFLCSIGTVGTPIGDGVAGTLTLTGTAPSEPIFTVYGSGFGTATAIFTATEINAKLTIDLPAALASGDTLVVDFGQRTVTFTHSSVSHDYSGFIDYANSNWWNEADVMQSLLIGDNTLEVDCDNWSATAIPATW
ncbi:MAG TPA: hypothetical protein VFG23_12890 [Polyangia bacterium]|nr:hypothetical protein [Polyangia bacterium]